mmetsp:Transcript_37818/g.112347  ORF Transcript_37818/g.112347 Transcript_37818/m.112347 type:complete len:212 (+) Transcript_37818:306-941(+)
MSRLMFRALGSVSSSTISSAFFSASRASWLSVMPPRASNHRACWARASTRSSGNGHCSSRLRLFTTLVCVSSAFSHSWQAYCASATRRSSRKNSSLSVPVSTLACASRALAKCSTAPACWPRCMAMRPRHECTRMPRVPMSPSTSRPTLEAFLKAASAFSRLSSARCTVPSAMRMSTLSLWPCASSRTPPMFASRALTRWSQACLWYPPRA